MINDRNRDSAQTATSMMNNKVAIIISPNYQNYAQRYLDDCIESLRRQDWTGETTIFITDNESTEASYACLKNKIPEANILRNPKNDGFAKANNNAMKSALREGCDYLFLINMDTILETDCIRQLVNVAESDKSIGAAQARIMLWPDRNKINSLGNVTHFLGFGYCEGYGDDISNHTLSDIRDICFPSGAAALYKKDVLQKTGLFDEEFHVYNEDQDLGWRIWLAGWRCVTASQAVVYHKYEFSGHARKFYLLDRNRILTILKNYQLVTLFLIFPAFVVMELGTLLFALEKGWFKEKLNVYRYFLSWKNWKNILRARQTSQILRQTDDSAIIKKFSGRIWYDEVGDWKLRLVNRILNPYWRVIKWIMTIKHGAVN